MIQEMSHGRRQGRRATPPSKQPQNTRLPLSQLWKALPERTRQRTLQTLSEVILRHLQMPERQEVPDERR